MHKKHVSTVLSLALLSSNAPILIAQPTLTPPAVATPAIPTPPPSLDATHTNHSDEAEVSSPEDDFDHAFRAIADGASAAWDKTKETTEHWWDELTGWLEGTYAAHQTIAVHEEGLVGAKKFLEDVNNKLLNNADVASDPRIKAAAKKVEEASKKIADALDKVKRSKDELKKAAQNNKKIAQDQMHAIEKGIKEVADTGAAAADMARRALEAHPKGKDVAKKAATASATLPESLPTPATAPIETTPAPVPSNTPSDSNASNVAPQAPVVKKPEVAKEATPATTTPVVAATTTETPKSEPAKTETSSAPTPSSAAASTSAPAANPVTTPASAPAQANTQK